MLTYLKEHHINVKIIPEAYAFGIGMLSVGAALDISESLIVWFGSAFGLMNGCSRARMRSVCILVFGWTAVGERGENVGVGTLGGLEGTKSGFVCWFIDCEFTSLKLGSCAVVGDKAGGWTKMVKEIRWNKWKPNKSNKKILNDLKEIYVRL